MSVLLSKSSDYGDPSNEGQSLTTVMGCVFKKENYAKRAKAQESYGHLCPLHLL